MNVSLHVYYKNKDGLTYKKTLTYVNPDVPDEVLVEFLEKLNKLQTDKMGSIYKVIDEFLSKAKPEDEEITENDIEKILDGDYIVVPDDDGVTVEDILEILGGDFVPVDDPDGITQEDIDKIFNEE